MLNEYVIVGINIINYGLRGSYYDMMWFDL